jgi:hypothetical protein
MLAVREDCDVSNSPTEPGCFPIDLHAPQGPGGATDASICYIGLATNSTTIGGLSARLSQRSARPRLTTAGISSRIRHPTDD